MWLWWVRVPDACGGSGRGGCQRQGTELVRECACLCGTTHVSVLGV